MRPSEESMSIQQQARFADFSNMNKKTIREEMRAKRHEITKEERKQASKEICHTLIESRKINLLLSSWNIAVYISTTHEIRTRYIIQKLWNAGRNVCVPAWNKEQASYKLGALLPDMKFITGPFNVREPAVHIPVPIWDVDAFIIPGLAFDMYGARLGFGAGFYDKILAVARKSARIIAVCYDWQVIEGESLPQEPHDIKVGWIVTDKRVIKCGKHHNRQGSEERIQELE